MILNTSERNRFSDIWFLISSKAIIRNGRFGQSDPKEVFMKKVAMPKISVVASSAGRKSRTSRSGPTQDEIQLRAYEIYVERHGAPGDALEDWVQAERELLQKQQKARRNGKPKAA